MAKWVHREDLRQGDSAHNILFKMWERSTEDSRGEAAFGEKKFHLNGKISLTLALGQTKYGDELIAQIYGHGGELKTRKSSRYNRVQVYLGPADLQTAECLEEIAKAIREEEKKSNEDNG